MGLGLSVPYASILAENLYYRQKSRKLSYWLIIWNLDPPGSANSNPILKAEVLLFRVGP